MSVYRNAVWFVKGLQEYTRSGYEAASQRFVTSDLEVDLSGRSFMITGANSGLGKRTALEVATRGGTVHLLCRNQSRAEAARQEIMELSKNQNVHVVDLSNARGVWEFAQSFSESSSLHVLALSRGCMVDQRELTEDGLEKNFATNTLGVSSVTTALVPALKRAQDPRVVTVSSGGMFTQKLNVDDLQFEKGTFDGTAAYAQNKRQQVILTERWASQHKEIHFSSMHPGWADNPGLQTSMPAFHAKMRSRLRTEAMGAAAAAAQQPSGLFFQDRRAVAAHLPLASSPQEEEQLLAALEFSLKFRP
ncbi:dehydrogenase/reductase SDR family member 12 [Pseudoliparis swirei]|uniref:dehydrogenase/reductase SDR family member 12 n=1 Tax=Pseudoliparis swirei TaxID=2059687 RepID=UPI0024BD92CB|nr:dehydrogenase/reductase SDR family member 12 [Pseudoliparis swirei]